MFLGLSELTTDWMLKLTELTTLISISFNLILSDLAQLKYFLARRHQFKSFKTFYCNAMMTNCT